ncbi:MAG: acyl-CoA thioesterase [Chitinophagales bacterium]|nr:acyl-CoA thioesterase [Chitinophagales bacterium]
MRKFYRYEHIVGFEETNLVGNVYYANHIKWQGRCREMFLKDHAPAMLEELEKGKLALVTLNCSCEYFGELKAFDRVVLEMELGKLNRNRLEMLFRYTLNDKIIAKGKQEIACMIRSEHGLEPSPFPDYMQKALHEFEMP